MILIVWPLIYLFIPVSSLSTTGSSATSKSNPKWTPKIKSLEERRKLRGLKKSSELIGSKAFHHIEFYCGDAKSTAIRFSLALGIPITCVTGQHTGNDRCVSYGSQSGDVRFIFTAPYSEAIAKEGVQMAATGAGVTFDASEPLPGFDVERAHAFFRKHGLGVKAIGIEVESASKAFHASVAKGGNPVMEPVLVPACPGYLRQLNVEDSDENRAKFGCEMAEVELYGDVVLRYVSFASPKPTVGDASLSFLPHLTSHDSKRKTTYGIRRIDHAVGNVDDLYKYYNYVSKMTGFHEFAEFTAEDVGTVESGLNSVVLASDTEHVLLPLNEPTQGKRKSQIQTFLEQNEGPGLQHLALKTDDIFETVSKVRMAEEELGGFDLMRRPSDEYYRELPDKLGDQLTPEQYAKCEELGILADADDEGILLQIFTKPIGDRPTFFIEIIQRLGCLYTPSDTQIEIQRPGCGGFGQGNFKELFKAIEEHEKTLKV